MVADGRYVAVLDRFEGAVAVLLLERGGETVDELAVRRDRLPADAGQDAVLDVTVTDGDLVRVSYDPDETAERTGRAQRRFDRLARRPPDEDDGRGTGGDERRADDQRSDDREEFDDEIPEGGATDDEE